MSVCDSTGAKVDREEEEWRDARICHWGNEGLRSSAFNASSCLTNGRGVFRIKGSRLGCSFVNVTPVFFCSHLSSSVLFSCTFLSFLTLLCLSGDFSHSLLAPDHRSPIVCLLHHSRVCPSSVIIPIPASPPIYSLHPLSFHSHSHICLRILLFVTRFFLSQVTKQMIGWIEPSHCCVVTDSILEGTDINSWVSCQNELEVWESTE